MTDWDQWKNLVLFRLDKIEGEMKELNSIRLSQIECQLDELRKDIGRLQTHSAKIGAIVSLLVSILVGTIIGFFRKLI